MHISRHFPFIVCLLLLLPPAARADVRLFTGNLEVIKTSGKACSGYKKNHQISLVIGSDDSELIFGYVGGETITVGQLRGRQTGSLEVRYPYPDAVRAEGHVMKVEINGSMLNGELHDRHLDAAVDDCNVDLGRVKLVQVDGSEAAQEAYKRLAMQFEAQLMRSTAMQISRSGAHVEAVEYFEKALALADTLYQPDSARLLPYLSGLANGYMRAGRYSDFTLLYDARIAFIKDDAVRLIFNHHQVRSLLQIGRAALGRDEHTVALEKFKQALTIDYRSKDVIAANMSALVHMGKHDEAIAFLEETEQKLDNEPDRQDVREATALVAYRKAQNEQKEGRAVEAERFLRKAMKLDPGTAHYVVVLARWTHKADKYQEADMILKRGIESFKEGPQRQELIEARKKLQQTELILAKIRRAGN